MFTAEHIKIANDTSRGRGSVGRNAVVPRAVVGNVSISDSILDFGAGKDALHALRLREEHGLDVIAYEFGDNVVEGIHDPEALSRTYDVVYASNVLNVQSDLLMLHCTIMQIFDACRPGGTVIVNLPREPRKGAYDDMTPTKARDHVACVLSGYGDVRVEGRSDAPIFIVSRH